MNIKLTKKIKIAPDGTKLYQIKCIKEFTNKSFGKITVGTLGGWVESLKLKNGTDRISGNAWISGNAMVYGNTMVSGNARVYENAKVSGNTMVYGNARVYENAKVSGNTMVYGNARVSGNARVFQGYINKFFDKNKDRNKYLRYELAKQLGITTFNDIIYLHKRVNKTNNPNIFTSCYDETFKYEIGKTAKVKNYDTSDASCSSGLHCGTALYWDKGDTLIEVEVNLKDIITIQQGKVRCKALKVMGVVDFD